MQHIAPFISIIRRTSSYRQCLFLLAVPAGVFLLPYQNIYLSDNGATDSQLGVLCALRPWLGMAATMLGPLIADRLNCHRGELLCKIGEQ